MRKKLALRNEIRPAISGVRQPADIKEIVGLLCHREPINLQPYDRLIPGEKTLEPKH